MNGSIQRAGRWWHRRDDGGWLQWDEANETWVATAAAPPPPPPPPAGPVPPSAAPAPARVGAAPSAGARDRLGDLAYSVREKPLLWSGVGAAAVALLAVVLIGFLGGGQSSPAPVAASAAQTGAEGTKAAFIQKADALCAAALAEQKSLLQPGTIEELPAYIDRSVGISRRLVRDLKRLRPPAEDRRSLRQMFKKADQMIALAGRLEDAAMRGDQAGVQAIVTQSEKLTNQANALALQYGLGDCSRSA